MTTRNGIESFNVEVLRLGFASGEVCTAVSRHCGDAADFQLTTRIEKDGMENHTVLIHRACRNHLFTSLMEAHRANRR